MEAENVGTPFASADGLYKILPAALRRSEYDAAGWINGRAWRLGAGRAYASLRKLAEMTATPRCENHRRLFNGGGRVILRRAQGAPEGEFSPQ